MKKNNTLPFPLRAVLCMLALLLPLSALGCGEEEHSDMPSPAESFYVYDEAQVLESELEDYIVAVNDALFHLSGAQLVVACVNTTGFYDTGDYAMHLFNAWGIGSAEKNNGILLLLTIGEQDYWCVTGKGLEDSFSSGTIKLFLNGYLEEDFAAADYTAGVRKVFDAMIAHLEKLYSISLADWDGESGDYTPSAPGEGEEIEERSSSVSILAWAVIIVIVILLIISFTSRGDGSGGPPRRQHRRTVYTTPTSRPRSYGTAMPRPTVRPPVSPRPGTTRPGGSHGSTRPGTSRPGGSYGGSYGGSRPGASRPGGSYGGSRGGSFGGSRGGSFGGGRSGGGGFTRGGGAGRR